MIVFSSAPASSSVCGQLHDRRLALADRHVDADQVAVLVVDDRVDRDRGLAGLAVADDQLALTAADRDHRVDRLEAGEHRLLDRLALDDARRLVLGRARARRCGSRLCRRAGLPSGSTIRPSSPRRPGSPAGAWCATVSPSTIFSHSPNSTAPTLSDSRFSASPVTPCGSSSISNDMQFSSPWMRQMPSATDSTVPTSASSALGGVEALDPALEDGGDLVWLDVHLCWAPCDARARPGRLACEVVPGGCGSRRRG